MAAYPPLPAAPSAKRPSAPAEVLLVDDQQDSAVLIKHYLEKAGFMVRRVDTGEQALASVPVLRPSVVLLDILLPGIDGLEVCRRLKSESDTLDIPVILVTGMTRSEDRVRGIEAGADDFLSKPVNPEELVARVRTLARLTEMRRALEYERLEREVDQRRQMQRTFERYIAPEVLSEVLAAGNSPESLLARQTRTDAIALFADLRGFTRMSEMLEADRVVALLNEFFTTLTEVTYAYEGTVFNMAGDSLLIGFNVPLPREDSPTRAILAACTMQSQFQDVARRWKTEDHIDVGLGIGICGGPVVVGNVGSRTYMTYTMIGDAVNVAARLMQSAKSGEILISKNVLDRTDGLDAYYQPEPIEPILLKGKSRPIEAYRIAPVFADYEQAEDAPDAPAAAGNTMSLALSPQLLGDTATFS
ncbi:MAG: response regulator [Pseudomonadota bacterium]|nr:response regulator [Pseudomonadota bacterium]